MPKKPKFTMDDFFAQMDEIRGRHRTKPTNLIERLRQVAGRPALPRLPKLPK